MRERAGVQQDEIRSVGCGLLYAIDNLMLGVTLKALQAMAEFRGEIRQTALDLSQAGVAVDARFTAAKKVQVGSVYQQKARHYLLAQYQLAEDGNNSTFFPGRWRKFSDKL